MLSPTAATAQWGVSPAAESGEFGLLRLRFARLVAASKGSAPAAQVMPIQQASERNRAFRPGFDMIVHMAEGLERIV